MAKKRRRILNDEDLTKAAQKVRDEASGKRDRCVKVRRHVLRTLRSKTDGSLYSKKDGSRLIRPVYNVTELDDPEGMLRIRKGRLMLRFLLDDNYILNALRGMLIGQAANVVLYEVEDQLKKVRDTVEDVVTREEQTVNIGREEQIVTSRGNTVFLRNILPEVHGQFAARLGYRNVSVTGNELNPCRFLIRGFAAISTVDITPDAVKTTLKAWLPGQKTLKSVIIENLVTFFVNRAMRLLGQDPIATANGDYVTPLGDDLRRSRRRPRTVSQDEVEN